MPDPNQQPRDSAIEAVGKDREFAIEEWKSTQESIAQFNDLGLRMRVFGIGGVFLVAGIGIQSIKDDQLFWLLGSRVHSSALIVLISWVLLCAVFALDEWYYTPLLIGAVVYGMEIERALRNGTEILNRERLEHMNKNEIPIPVGRGDAARVLRQKNLAHSHIWGKSAFMSHHVSRVNRGLTRSLWVLYGGLTVVLLFTAWLLNTHLPNR